MLSVADVLDILSIPLLGIIPESQEVLRASNVGAPVTMNGSASLRGPRLYATPRAASPARPCRWRSRTRRRPCSTACSAGGPHELLPPVQDARLGAGGARAPPDPLAHERVAVGPRDLVAILRDELLATIRRHVEIDPEKLSVKMDRSAGFSTLEIDVEIPCDKVALPARGAEQATAA